MWPCFHQVTKFRLKTNKLRGAGHFREPRLANLYPAGCFWTPHSFLAAGTSAGIIHWAWLLVNGNCQNGCVNDGYPQQSSAVGTQCMASEIMAMDTSTNVWENFSGGLRHDSICLGDLQCIAWCVDHTFSACAVGETQRLTLGWYCCLHEWTSGASRCSHWCCSVGTMVIVGNCVSHPILLRTALCPVSSCTGTLKRKVILLWKMCIVFMFLSTSEGTTILREKTCKTALSITFFTYLDVYPHLVTGN